MKTFPLFLLAAGILSAPFTASACIDRDAKPFAKPYEALREFEKNSREFGACLDKLTDAGVDLREALAWRKDRPANDNGPVTYTIVVQGKDAAGLQVKLAIPYSLAGHRFSCGALDYRIPRCL